MSKTTDQLDGVGAPPDDTRAALGMVATSHPVAADIAVDVLRRGGHAVDAAVAAAAALGVVDPMSTGLGGDCFALVWDEASRTLEGINGSGRAPAAASARELRDDGRTQVPEDGAHAVTVPGALHAWQQLVARWGRVSLGDLLAPASRVAREGFEVSPVVGRDWEQAAPRLRRGYGTDVYLPGGRAPRAGERFAQPELAATLDRIAHAGIEWLYGGELGAAMAATCRQLGGWLSLEDLEAHASTWVSPMEASYRGHPVFELPPNGQGVVVLEALRILDGFPLGDLSAGHRAHLIVEALKLAFADAARVVGDPDEGPDASVLLDDDFIEARIEQIGERALAEPAAAVRPAADTVYVAVVDGEGNACSLINSVYMHFGANVVVPGTGVCLQNRGALFSLEPGHPSYLAPGRRPYHTIIPAMVFRMGRPWIVLGVVGGFQQPQGQVQILTHVVDGGRSLQEAVDAPRLRWIEGARLRVEAGMDAAVVAELERRGHVLTEVEAHGGFGGAQAIEIDPDTLERRGATDPRKDGVVRVTSE